MNRRESRVSTGARQNDALFEFESFKKKFLLANKHITKLNSTLSVRIEELNAQISTLYVENLRLRASEIALTAELKKEREKSRKIIAEAETATASLSQHLVFLRHTLNVRPASPPPSSPPPPKARRPVISSVASPQVPRLSRPPSFPGIFEEDEDSSENGNPKYEPSRVKSFSPSRTKTKSRSRSSTSRLPLPARNSPPSNHTLPPPPAPSLTMEVALSGGGVTVKKLSRRRGGLLPTSLDVSPPLRPPSPAFGSPILGGVALEEDGESPDGKGAVESDGKAEQVEGEEPEKLVKRDKRKGKQKEREPPEKDEELFIDAPRPREREWKRLRDEDTCVGATAPDSKLKLQDVTNSPRSRSVLPPPDTGATDRGRHQNADPDIHGLVASQGIVSAPTTSGSPTQLPTPRASSSPVPVPPPESDAMVAHGRERRARKSVNYAEPKLNTKMRKPDPPPGSTSTTRKRSVAALFMNTNNVPQSDDDVDEPTPRSSLEHDVTPKPTKPPPSSSSLSLTAFPPPVPPLPRTLPAAANPPPLTSRPSAVTTVKRKKARSYVISSDDESDGVQGDVDADFDDVRSIGNGWLNVERRRRSVHASRGGGFGGEANTNGVESNEGRRHSVAV